MLGILAVVSLVLGAFVAGGAAFDWQFLFSDGYREHDWVRSFGHGGARGLLIVVGTVLVIGGFIGEVVDTAAKPVIVTADRIDQSTIENPEEPSRPASEATSGGATAGYKSPKVASSSTLQPNVPPPSYLPAAANNTTGTGQVGRQLITIWEPEAVDEEAGTLVTLQYRFEPGQQPSAKGQYYWVIESPSSTQMVAYDPELLQQQGQLTHLIRMPLATSGTPPSWSTYLLFEENQHRTQVSNRLQITSGAAIRSTPPPAP